MHSSLRNCGIRSSSSALRSRTLDCISRASAAAGSFFRIAPYSAMAVEHPEAAETIASGARAFERANIRAREVDRARTSLPACRSSAPQHTVSRILQDAISSRGEKSLAVAIFRIGEDLRDASMMHDDARRIRSDVGVCMRKRREVCARCTSGGSSSTHSRNAFGSIASIAPRRCRRSASASGASIARRRFGYGNIALMSARFARVQRPTLMMMLDVRARVLDEPAVVDAGGTRGFASAASEAQIEMAHRVGCRVRGGPRLATSSGRCGRAANPSRRASRCRSGTPRGRARSVRNRTAARSRRRCARAARERLASSAIRALRRSIRD